MAWVTPTETGLDLAILDLRESDRAEAALPTMEWPTNWSGIRDDLLAKRMGSGPPSVFRDPDGLLVEFPVFGDNGRLIDLEHEKPRGKRPNTRHRDDDSRSERPREIGWLVGEIDRAYLRDDWLPELVRAKLDPRGNGLHAVVVRSAAEPKRVLYSNAPPGSDQPDISLLLTTGSGLGEREGLWQLEVTRQAGAAATIVGQARWRNFLVAVALNGLMLALGLLVIHVTRRRRQLAEDQMRFVSTVTHELRTPLSVIGGAAQNLRRGIVAAPERISHYAEMIASNAGRLGNMIDDVLAFSRTESRGIHSANDVIVPVDDLLREALAEAAEDLRAHRCTIDNIPTTDGTSPSVRGDRAALVRVFRNLLANAAKHGGSDQSVTLRTRVEQRRNKSFVFIEVADCGPGIPKEERDRIFEPFYRGSEAERACRQGSGLRLGIVARTLAVHGGRIDLDCPDVGGSVFTVVLPIAQESGEPTAG